MFLTDEETATLTGYIRPSDQRRWLKQHGWIFEIARTGRLGLTGDELQLMRHFVDAYRDFWIRQPVKLYLIACDALNDAHKSGLLRAAA